LVTGGAPLAGKAALAKLLSTLFNSVHVSARELLRSAAASPNATLAAQIQHYTLRGELVPDDIVVPLMLQVRRCSKDVNIFHLIHCIDWV
jgi:adenylate kinase family enzyme